MESWRNHLQEEKYKQQILNYLEENNIVLTEEELSESMGALLKKYGTKAAVLAALASSGGQAQAGPVADFFKSKIQTQQTQQVDQETEAETQAQEGYSVVDGVHYFFVKGKPGDFFAPRQAQQNLMRKLVAQGGPLEGDTQVSGAVQAGYKNGMHGYMWSPETEANAKQMMQRMQQAAQQSR